MSTNVAMDAIQRFIEANDTTVVGSTFLFCGIVCVLPYFLVARLFVSEKDFQAITAYNIMFCISVCDILQLFCQIITAIFVFFQSTFMPIINKALCGICFLWGALFFSSYMTPYVGISFNPDEFIWSYDNGKYSDVVSTIEFIGSNTLLFATFCTYICIVVHVISQAHFLHFQRKKVHANKSQRKHELWLLVQSIILFLYCALLIFAWHYYYLFLPDTKWTYASINTFWILSGGLNPLLYLTMNRHDKDCSCVIKQLSTRICYFDVLERFVCVSFAFIPASAFVRTLRFGFMTDDRV
uniref:7TM GPCR serpentine receptor class x (Srx) domain-containing protein n=1 Tax=Ascaris lumbricoides TaxID=6252 RepID=A0A9J2PDY4_ASCLU